MGLRGDELRARVREAMDAVGLPFDAFKDRPLYSLSGGERRRAALAGVLAIKPEILVLDEPTAGLDPRGHKDILARLLALKPRWNMTMVFVSHNMEDIARVCDRVYVVADGQAVLSGTPRAGVCRAGAFDRNWAWGSRKSPPRCTHCMNVAFP